MANLHLIEVYYSDYDKKPTTIVVNIDNIVTISCSRVDKKITYIQTTKGTLEVRRPFGEVVVLLKEYYKKTTI